jgi:hypothetical protein
MMTFWTTSAKHCYWALHSSLTSSTEKAAASVRLDEIQALRAQGRYAGG